MVGFVLFSDARTYEHAFCVRYAFFDILTVRLHGRNNICKVLKRIGIIFLNKKIYRVTAGGDDNISVLFKEHTVIFGFDLSCAESRLFDFGKAELFQCVTHRLNACAVIVCDKRGRKADPDGVARLQKYLDFLDLACDLFCVLRAYDNTSAAENTLVAYYVRLISRKANRLNGTVAYAFVAVFAV